MSSSRLIASNLSDKAKSRLILSATKGIESLEAYEIKPKGVFGSEAKIISGGVTIKSSELDLEFTVKFDDDMEPNEAEVIVYNLSNDTISKLKNKAAISIEAGYKGDTGVVFSGYITKVSSKYEDADRATTINCIDDISKRTIEETTYAAGTKASYILKQLLAKTGTPIAVFKMRRDWTYKDEEKVDGDLYEAIKHYSEVCGVSTYLRNGKIISRSLKEGDALNFTLEENTGLIGSPEAYSETVKVEDYNDTVNGYEVESLFQHRFSAGGIVKLKSREVNGTYRICSGEHIFNSDEAISKVKMY